jgi:MraZ protein
MSVDAKGRVAVPAEFRRVLARGDPDGEHPENPTCCICYGAETSPWLECYTVASLEAMQAKADALEDDDPRREMAMDYYFTYVKWVQLDDQGRILLPEALRGQIQLGRKARFAGRGQTFRILSPEVPAPTASPLKAHLAESPGERFNPRALVAPRRPDAAPLAERATEPAAEPGA